ncbi:hypothetical protein Goklo_025296, partial [Gossypium klotzschianum]|nr:hypothetical protein [Gossypium klotzschianum]
MVLRAPAHSRHQGADSAELPHMSETETVILCDLMFLTENFTVGPKQIQEAECWVHKIRHDGTTAQKIEQVTNSGELALALAPAIAKAPVVPCFPKEAARSVDHGSKATLPLTIPRRVFKLSAKDSTRRSVGITLQKGTRDLSAATAALTTYALGGQRPLLLVGNRATGVFFASSPDSDLEAFSHNPAHGSFAPLAFQPSTMTNCANQRFLSYK